MKTTSIRHRLLAVLALPVVALALVAGLNVSRAGAEVERTRRQTQQAIAAGGPATLITALLDERNYTGVHLIGLEDLVQLRVTSLAEGRDGTDARLREFRRQLDSTPNEVRDVYEPALDAAEAGLAELRRSVDEDRNVRNLTNLFADEVFSEFTDLAALFHEANDQSIEQIQDQELRNMARSVADLSRTADLQAQLARAGALAQMVPGRAAVIRNETAGSYAQYLYFQDRSTSLLSSAPEALEVLAAFYGRPNQAEFRGLVEQFVSTGEVNPVELIAAAGDTRAPNATHAWEAIRKSLRERGDALVDRAESDRLANAAALLVTIAGTVTAALNAARGLSRPLHRLAAEANSMSTEVLPAAVAGVLETPLGEDITEPELRAMTTSSITEVAELAEALDSVQRRALELAVEQAALRHNSADSLVNLGRRVQGLVGRQLEVLAELEETEDDEVRLETLFQADHLATRVRRNAESLVVLAGTNKVQRRAGFGPPAPLEDVVRAAIAEVEQIDRIELLELQEARVTGQSANDLAHILAELVENGLSFSPPQTTVEVRGAAAADGSYRIEIIDAGIGMGPIAMGVANLRLAGSESFSTTPSKYLGHYVVGHLAARHGIDVSLSANRAGGVTSTLVLPTDLMTEVVQSDPTTTDHDTVGTESRFGTYSAYVASNRSLHELVAARRVLDEQVRMPV